MMPLVPALLSLLWRACASAPPMGDPVNCYIVNLDYVNCSWNQPKAPELNYTFFSNFKGKEEKECPEYELGERGVTVGCRVPYQENLRFYTFHTSLRGSGGLLVEQQHSINTEDKIKMNPPTSLALRWKDKSLVFSWEVRSGVKQKHCLQSRVQYGLNDKWQNPVEPSAGSMDFTVPQPSRSSRHRFRVQVRLVVCGSSPWSEWSDLIEWGNRTVPSHVAPPSGTRVSLYMFGLLAAVFLLLLTCLLVHSERLRVTLIPAVPTPVNLKELIDTYNGNVEKWLCISKELQEGLKPSFTEHPYTAREYRLVGQSSVESDSGVSLSDSPSISSSSSSSSCSSSSSSTSQTSDGSC